MSGSLFPRAQDRKQCSSCFSRSSTVLLRRMQYDVRHVRGFLRQTLFFILHSYRAPYTIIHNTHYEAVCARAYTEEFGAVFVETHSPAVNSPQQHVNVYDLVGTRWLDWRKGATHNVLCGRLYRDSSRPLPTSE